MTREINKNYLELETPCYILDASKLDKNYDDLVKAFKNRWNNFIVGYSYKTNSLPWVIKFLKDKGSYAEVVSEMEYRLALKIGYQPDKIIFNGPYKGDKALQEGLEEGAIINLDSFHEIEWIKRNKPKLKQQWKVGVRINFNLEKYCPGETVMGEEPGRFGFNVENGSFKAAIEELEKLSHVKIVGIHGHHSTKTKSLEVFKTIAKKILEVTVGMREAIEYIDMGGCIFGDKPGAPSFKQYADVIIDILEPHFNKEKVMLILEPGAAIIASPFKYLCKAIDKKDVQGTRFVSTDGSLIHISPQMNGVKFYQEIFSTGRNIIEKQVISGFTCVEKDRMGSIEEAFEINPGDYILTHNTGAYSMALSPLFIQYYPNVYVETNNTMVLVRKAWGVDEYIMNSVI